MVLGFSVSGTSAFAVVTIFGIIGSALAATAIAATASSATTAAFRLIFIIAGFVIGHNFCRFVAFAIGFNFSIVFRYGFIIRVITIILTAPTIAATATTAAALIAIVFSDCCRITFHARHASGLRIIGQGDGHFHCVQFSVNFHSDGNARACFNLMQLCALIIKQVNRYILRQVHGQFAFGEFTGILVNLAQHMQSAAFDRTHHA